MKAGCGVTPPPTGIPPTKDGGVPCMSGALLPKETTINFFFFLNVISMDNIVIRKVIQGTL
jgi:hypothetical protein